MGKKLRWRLLLIVLVIAGAVAGYVFTGYRNAKKEWTGPGGPTVRDALKNGIKRFSGELEGFASEFVGALAREGRL